MKRSTFAKIALSADRKTRDQATGFLLILALRALALLRIGRGSDLFEPGLACITIILIERHFYSLTQPKNAALKIDKLRKSLNSFTSESGDPVAQMDRAGAF
jgi:hypothetical protein